MPVTFACKSCQQSLQVDDSLAGKLVACPKCGNQQVVESPAAFSFSSPQNPYQSPNPVGSFDVSAHTSNQMIPTQFDVGWVFNHSLALWKQNLGLLVGMVAVTFGISMLQSIIETIINVAMANVRDQAAQIAFLLGKLSLSIIVAAVNFWIQIGQVRICLNLLRGNKADFNQLFSGGDVFLPVFGVSLLFFIAAALGFVLLIIPFILVFLYLWPVYYFVLDKKSGVIESFTEVLPFTKINALSSFVVFLIGAGLYLLGLLACCVGLFFAVPLVMLFSTACYLAMTGQLSQTQQSQPQYNA